MQYPLDTHLHHSPQPHKEEHLQSSEFLRDVVIGMSDGLTVPFALAAGLSGVVSTSTGIIIIAGIACGNPFCFCLITCKRYHNAIAAIWQA